jgi:hypothetical protein
MGGSEFGPAGSGGMGNRPMAGRLLGGRRDSRAGGGASNAAYYAAGLRPTAPSAAARGFAPSGRSTGETLGGSSADRASERPAALIHLIPPPLCITRSEAAPTPSLRRLTEVFSTRPARANRLPSPALRPARLGR